MAGLFEKVDAFCESKLSPGPELLNTWTALCVSFVGLSKLTSVLASNNRLAYYMLVWNGIFSALYHYYQIAVWKYLDEVSMLLVLAHVSHQWESFMLANVVLVFYPAYFPIAFGSYLALTCYQHKLTLSDMQYALIAITLWIVTENWCEYFYWTNGHAVWHVYMSMFAMQHL